MLPDCPEDFLKSVTVIILSDLLELIDANNHSGIFFLGYSCGNGKYLLKGFFILTKIELNIQWVHFVWRQINSDA